MYSTSQHFRLVYFGRFATFSKARHAVIYGVGSLDDRRTPNVQKACRSLRRWASQNGENFQFLYKYDKISLSGQICQHKASCTPGFVEQRTCITNWGGGGLGGAHPPPFEKHGQRSEHTSFLQLLNMFFGILLAVAGGWAGRSPPLFQNMDEDQNTYLFLHPSDGFVLQRVLRCVHFTRYLLFAVCLLFQEARISELERLIRSFPRSLDAVIYDIRNLSCSSNMRNLSRTANIAIYSFPGF